MATGAVITINSANSLFGNGLTNPLFSPSGFELFSDIINPIESARATGRTIKSELRNISLQLEISSTVDQLLKRDSEFSRAKKEVIENAKCAKNDQDVIYGALTNVKDKLSEFGDTVVAVDNRAASLIRERKLEFNKRYPHLESESEYRKRMDERSIWEKCKDFGYGFVHGYGLIGGIDSLINGRERFVEHKEAIKQKITEFACKVGEWVKRNWEALVAAIVVVAAAIVCIATFGAGTVFLVASLAAFAYAVADKIVAINNNGKGIVETLEANGFHHLSQFCKGFNWGLQITMVISGFKMNGLGADKLFINKASWLQNTKATKLIEGFSVFKGKGFLSTVGNGAIFGSADMLIVDLAAYGLNFAFSGDAQSNPSEYFKLAFKDTLKDTVSGFVVGGTVAGISHIAINGYSFFRAKFNQSPQYLNIGDEFKIIDCGDGNFNVNGKTLSRNEVINPNTGEFQYKYGEMTYSSDNVYSKSYNLKSEPRRNIQIDAVKNQLEQNPNYFKKFGCDKTTPNGVVEWFGDKKTNPLYMLHETLNNKVQIVPRKLNALVDHGGGNAMEKVTRSFWNDYDRYISNGFNDPMSPLRGKTIDEMKSIYQNATSKIQHSNFTIDSFQSKGTERYVSDVFGFDIP